MSLLSGHLKFSPRSREHWYLILKVTLGFAFAGAIGLPASLAFFVFGIVLGGLICGVILAAVSSEEDPPFLELSLAWGFGSVLAGVTSFILIFILAGVTRTLDLPLAIDELILMIGTGGIGGFAGGLLGGFVTADTLSQTEDQKVPIVSVWCLGTTLGGVIASTIIFSQGFREGSYFQPEPLIWPLAGAVGGAVMGFVGSLFTIQTATLAGEHVSASESRLNENI